MSNNNTDATDKFEQFSFEQLGQIMQDDNHSIAYRSRMLWYLRALPKEQHAQVVQVLAKGLGSKSALLRHELCYVMGQMGSIMALPVLNAVLADTNENCMVRHEAGEALGAIGEQESLPILNQFLQDPLREIRETCEIAIENIKERLTTNSIKEGDEEFSSVDPAPAEKVKKTTEELRQLYLDSSAPIYQRYKAMFGLRNRAQKHNDKSALLALCEGFKAEEGALFKHEVAFVLGQLQRHETAKALESVLADANEHPMVRHEAAEALGSISDPESLQLLETFQKDDAEAVRDSCIVAQDMHQYWSKFSQVMNDKLKAE